MGKSKTSGSGYITGSGNNNGGYIEVGGNISHQPDKNTKIKVDGNINRTQPSRGKGKTGGGATITITKDF